MSHSTPTRDPISPDDALPPVEPPTAGFILQLFVVPAVIVLIIVLVWLLFNWLAHMGDDPYKYIEMLRRDNAARWQAASTLADQLRQTGPKSAQLKQDTKAAGDLAAILHEQIADGERLRGEDDIKLRVYLSRALGEFEVTTGAGALIEAAQTQRYDEELKVRRAALEGLALLAEHNKDDLVELRPEVMPVLLEGSRDREAGIRLAAAFALGVVGGDEAQRRLEVMLSDAYPSVRFNAATGLARHGNPAAMDVLVEMLDPEELPGEDAETSETAREAMQLNLRSNALRASVQLSAADPSLDTAPLVDAIETLLDQDELDGHVRIEATSALRMLRRQGEPATAAAN